MLINFPAADTLGHREATLGYIATGEGRRIDNRYSHTTSWTLGLFDKSEFGIGHNFLGAGTFSLKYSLWDDIEAAPSTALAVGFMNVSGARVDPYISGRVDLSFARIHVGVGRFDQLVQGYAGLDASLGQYGLLAVEYGSSPNGSLTAAWGYTVPKTSLFLQVGINKPNRGSNGWTHFGAVTYGFRF